MKNFVRFLSVVLVAVMVALPLTACGAVPSGTYIEGDTKITMTYTQYKFSGSKVEHTAYILGEKVDATSFTGKYKVEGESIIFTWTDADGEKQTDTKAFRLNDDGSIKIGILTYKKSEK